MVLALALIHEQERVFIDCGSGKKRYGTWLKDTQFRQEERKALIDFHVFTDNDYVASLLQKGKEHCSLIMAKSNRLWKVFTKLGTNWEL